MHYHELLLVIHSYICTCSLGALPYVTAPVNCYATVIALSGFCFGSTQTTKPLCRQDNPSNTGMVMTRDTLYSC